MDETYTRGEDEIFEPGEILRDDWGDFLERFALHFEGWIVDVDWLGIDPEDQDTYEESLVDDYAEYRLEGIDSDLDLDTARIVIVLSEGRRIVLDQPERIEIVDAEGPSDECLEIEASGVTLRMHLRFANLAHLRSSSPPLGFSSEESGLPDEDEPEAVEEELHIVGELPF